jgi:hypothetical protein
MRKLEWSDRQLEEILRQMPKIKDCRFPHDIYQNLPIHIKRKKHKTWVLPGIAMVAALLLLCILVPNATKYSNRSADVAKSTQPSTAKNQLLAKVEISKQDSSTGAFQKQDSSKLLLKKGENLKSAVYNNEIGNGKVLTYWIPDQQGQFLVPISIIITHPGNKSWLELLNENMTNLNEKEWGLSEFYPLNAKMSLDHKDNSVIVDVPKNNSYEQGSTNELSFINAIQQIVSTNSTIKKVKFTTNGSPGIMFGNTGVKMNMAIHPVRNRAFLFYLPEGKGIPFLVPSPDSFKDIQTALKAMEMEQPELGLKASLPKKLQIKLDGIKNRTLFLSVQQKPIIESIPMEVYSYEAILLTAKEFGFKNVMLKNSILKTLGPFDLTKINSVPIAPNLRQLKDQP